MTRPGITAACAFFVVVALPADVLAAEAPGSDIEIWRSAVYVSSVVAAGLLGMLTQRTSTVGRVPVAGMPMFLAAALLAADIAIDVVSSSGLFSTDEAVLPLLLIAVCQVGALVAGQGIRRLFS